ncbi:hypothetical protein OIU77_029575 [Salix suchowensis]|uniref:Uncharacterized protein n=1 Tax=Salix suchowensis TaxID=1278906 RepID=A0ABQ9BAI6_9ROSI|nr:hypothetical protein OIU78_003754 [Salix suchowensis]KAJ6380702.1 hypothetical protein OIU77_029575 [Salix suchowensis]
MGQGSFCSLTLDEVQDQLGNLGKPLGTMNLDELLRSVDSVGAWSEQMHRQGSLTWSRDLSKMTVEEIWRDIQQQNQNQNQKEADNPWRNAPFGEMTLDDFLVKAGVIAEPDPDTTTGI